MHGIIGRRVCGDIQISMDELITLDYGSGGKKTSKLIDELLVPVMDLGDLSDGAVLDDEIAFSTDSFVVDPIFFPGGDIGKLSVCGTVNDISMCGAVPEYLSLAFIIEEGFELENLKKIISSIEKTAKAAGVRVVTGDTKVVEKGRGDKIYINTSGIGHIKYKGLGVKNIRTGDKVIVSGTIGDHGTAVMLARSGMMTSDLKSDCAPLNGLCEKILSHSDKVRVLRDPTRGGVATTLNEFIEGSDLSVELDETALPIKGEVQSACDMLGLDPLYCANEGKLLCVIAPEDAQKVAALMPEGRIIGEITGNYPGKVILKTRLGGSRILQKLAGAQLPRIC